MPSPPKPFFVAGRAQTAPGLLRIIDKHHGTDAGVICVPGAEAVDRAITAAVGAVAPMRTLSAFRRGEALTHVARRLREKGEEFSRVLCAEVGKPIVEARKEVARAIDTFRIGAAEATRLPGEYIPLDGIAQGDQCEAICRRVPIGACSFITPFNFPLNLAAHKIAPAIAAGCPFILKPDPRTPLTTLMLGEILAETDLPAGAFSILPVTDDAARDMFVTDDRLALLSFTGSSAVGWEIRRRAGQKKVLLELGGNAACIVDAPIGRADVERIADRLCWGAFSLAGQSCVSVQRILIHRAVYRPVVDELVSRAKRLRPGDPRDESTRIGPMISVEAAERVESWVEEAAQAGAAVLCGGQRVGAFMDPTILEGVPPQARLVSEEAFGPVAVVQPFEAFDEALSVVNASRYGLQAGVFTASLSHAFRAWNTLDVGAVIINDVPTTRLDAMPYGGVKDSGVGREGVRYAILEMTEMRTMMLRNVGKVRGASSSSGRRETAADEKSLSDTQAVFEARGPDDTHVPI